MDVEVCGWMGGWMDGRKCLYGCLDRWEVFRWVGAWMDGEVCVGVGGRLVSWGW